LIALLGTVGTAPPPSGAAGETSTAGDKPPSRAEEIAGARRKLKILYDGVWQIERVLKVAGSRPVRASCVEERLAEAKAHLRLGSEEVARLEESNARHAGDAPADDDADTRAYALMRLDMLVERAAEVERTAELCVAEDASGIDVKQIDVEISPPPPPARTAPSAAHADAQKLPDQKRDGRGAAADQQHSRSAP
jgi:hypothetical protein